MNPQSLFCQNDACPSRGCTEQGNIRVHCSLTDRFVCTTCGQTFTITKGTAFYRLRTDPQTVCRVLTLLAYGCPIQAIVQAFALDERTVRRWQNKAGQHCEQVHAALVTQSVQNLQHVQADEIRVRLQARLVVWMAMAIAVPTRLWLGGVVSAHRDTGLIARLVAQVKACALCAPVLVVTDGLQSYVSAWQKAFRSPVRTGRQGRPRLQPWPTLLIGQVVKQRRRGRVVGVEQRLVQGRIDDLPLCQPDENKLNTAYIERLNATFRHRLACLVRRGRGLARHEATLWAGMYLVGSVYNFCTPHRSLCDLTGERTPAMAAGLTDALWDVSDLLTFRVAPKPFVSPKRRGRRAGTGRKQQAASAPT